VKEAERKVCDAWQASGMARTKLPLEEKQRTLNEALVAARADARALVRPRWAREAEQLVELPPHITRMPRRRT
jgi:hypothetical protein